MKIDELDVLTRNALADQYRREGMVVIPGLELPNSFQPPITDIVLLNVNHACEVYIACNVAYHGSDSAWQRVLRRSGSPGGTRRVLSAQGDLFTGLGKFKSLMSQAGGEYPTVGPATTTEAESGVASEPADPATSPLELDRPLPEARTASSRSTRRGGAGNGRGAVGLRDLVEEGRRHREFYARRETLLRALKTNLIRATKPGVLLLGDPGVGKTVLVKTLAQDIANLHDLPPSLERVAILDLPLGALVENSRYVGDIERQMRRIIENDRNQIIFADELHQLVRPELKPLSDVLKPALANGDIRMIGATTPIEWRRVEDAAFRRRFLEMTIEEPSPAETFSMVLERARFLAERHELQFGDEVIREAIMLAARYMPMRKFPDKAVDVLDLAAALQITNDSSHKSPMNSHPATEEETEHEKSTART